MMRAITTGLLAAGLLTAAPGHADTNQAAYANEVLGFGVPGPSDVILNNGYVICAALRSNTDTVATAGAVSRNASIPIDQAGVEVGAAIRWLCPDQMWQAKELANADQTVPGVTWVRVWADASGTRATAS